MGNLAGCGIGIIDYEKHNEKSEIAAAARGPGGRSGMGCVSSFVFCSLAAFCMAFC